MSGDQYDAIGGHWETTHDLPVFRAMHRALPALAGDVAGLEVLDVATGTGTYARAWAAAGARRVVGTDRSAEMVAAARRIERERPSGVEYHVADAAEHPQLGPFDLVTAALLLNYARDAATLTAMARGLYANLRPGGRLIGLLPEPAFRFDGPPPGPFGVDHDRVAELGIGTLTLVTLHTRPPIEFEMVLARRDVHEDGLRDAGFEAPRWYPLHEPDPRRPDPLLDGLAENPPVTLFETFRPG